MNFEDKLVVRERVAAKMIGVSTSALRRWRAERRGPRFIRLERAIGYRLADIEEFLDQHTVRPIERVQQ